MARVFIVHHRQHPFALFVALRPRLPLAADEPAGAVFAYARFGGEVPVVDVFAAAVAADVGDAAFVVIGRGDAGVAVEAGVRLAGGH